MNAEPGRRILPDGRFASTALAILGIGPVAPGIAGIAALATTDLEQSPGPVADDWFDAEAFIGKRGHKYFPQSGRLASAAARLALEDAGLGDTGAAGEDCGLIVGTNFGVHRVLADIDATVGEYGVGGLSPLSAPNFSVNLGASLTGIRTSTTGLNITLTDPVVAGLGAIVLAYHAVGIAGRILAGGAEDAPYGCASPLTGTGVTMAGASCLFVLEAAKPGEAGAMIDAAFLSRNIVGTHVDARFATRLAAAVRGLGAEVLVSVTALSQSLRGRLFDAAARALAASGRIAVRAPSFTDSGGLGAVSPLLPLAQAAHVRRDAIILAGSPYGGVGVVILKCSKDNTR